MTIASDAPVTDSEVSNAQFRLLANAMPTLAWMAHADGWIYWYNKRWYDYTGTTPEEMAGWGWQAVHDPDHLPRVLAEWTASIQSGKSWEMVFPLRGADGLFRPFLSRAEPLWEDGKLTGWFGNNVDISDQEQARERLQLMVNELNHRVKNTLATVQSVASQTFAGAPAEMRRSFDGRLMALSKVHEVLTRESWQRASLDEVVRSALAYCNPAQWAVDGPPVMIEPRIASALAMTLHELATNAVKYGALSSAEGKVRVDWRTERAGDGRSMLRLDWVESDGPPVAEPAVKGFGHKLISRLMTSDRGSAVRHDYLPDGVRCSITVPLGVDVLA